MDYTIAFTKDNVYINNNKRKKQLTLNIKTLIAETESNIEYQTSFINEKEIYGVLGIISFEDNYYLVYIIQANKICTIVHKYSIYQIKEVEFYCLNNLLNEPNSVISNIKIQELKILLANGMFYFSTEYDLSTSNLCQRGYLDYNASKKDYLWNKYLIEAFKYQSIDIGEYFVFCICGFIYSFDDKINDRDVQCILISRKKHNYIQSNHRQLEFFLDSEFGLFTFILYSFGYENELNKDSESILKIIQDNYSIYNGKSKNDPKSNNLQIEDKKKNDKNKLKQDKDKDKDKAQDEEITNLIFFIRNKIQENSNVEEKKKITEIQAMLFNLFDKQNHFSLNLSYDLSDAKMFIKGIKKMINNLSYYLITERNLTDVLDFNFDKFLNEKKNKLQIKHPIMISKDGIDLTIRFQKLFLWHIVDYFLNNNLAQIVVNAQIEDQKKSSNKLVSRSSSISSAIELKSTFNDMNSSMKFYPNYDKMFNEYYEHTMKQDKKNNYKIIETLFMPQKINDPAFTFQKSLANTIQLQPQKLKIAIVTWNVNALDLSKGNNKSKFDSLYDFTYFGSKFNADIIIFGFQEIVELKADNVIIKVSNTVKNEELWRKQLEEGLPNYKCILNKSLVGVLLLIFANEIINDKITNLECETIKTGFGGKLGNKGSCIGYFDYLNKKFSVATCHLAAGDSHNKNRIEELNSLAFHKKPNNQNFIDSDYWFIFGDCNFRLELDKHTTRSYLEKCAFDQLRAKDQLKISKYNLDFEYDEEEINFKPTYKLHNGKMTYNIKRNCAWCDRIIFKRSKKIQALKYQCLNLYISDHKPVAGLFEVFI